jgi:hypothetical protein
MSITGAVNPVSTGAVTANLEAVSAQKPVATSINTAPTGKQEGFISPRIVVDPNAGVITQFLGANGDVKAQIPSVTAVAYLRAGLTAEGLNKEGEGFVSLA